MACAKCLLVMHLNEAKRTAAACMAYSSPSVSVTCPIAINVKALLGMGRTLFNKPRPRLFISKSCLSVDAIANETVICGLQ